MNLRLASFNGRAHLVTQHTDTTAHLVDLENISGGKFSSNPMDAYENWDQLRDFVSTVSESGDEVQIAQLDSPSPRPRQLVAVGLNYRRHAIEFGLEIPKTPLVFAKFPSSVGAPFADVPMTHTNTDWEVELVLVVGSGGRNIKAADAWDHIAAICVGQDISNRVEQFATNPPQFSMGKSFKNHSVFGPWVVDARSIDNKDNLDLSCTVNGVTKQSSKTGDMIFPVSEIVEFLSSILELYPGDVIYTGTPSGVGNSRKPQEFLKKGDVVVSTLEGVGSITNLCV